MDWEQVLECVTPVVTDGMNQALMMPIMDEEIKEVGRQMGSLKASGPDGFSGIFYHSFWDNIGTEVNELVRFFMTDDVCPRQINATHIFLIPKVPNPELVSRFKPISLCNFSFKILSKVLRNRLKSLILSLIPPMQNAFVRRGAANPRQH